MKRIITATWVLCVVLLLLVWVSLLPVAGADEATADIPRPLSKALAIYKKGNA